MRRLMWIALAIMLAAIGGQSKAAPSMPIYFVGDWCFIEQKGTSTYLVTPSWSGGVCKEVLSVADNGFSGQGNHCEPIKTLFRVDFDPDGTAYVGIIIARCDGPLVASKIKTIEFIRHKGVLRVTPQ